VDGRLAGVRARQILSLAEVEAELVGRLVDAGVQGGDLCGIGQIDILIRTGSAWATPSAIIGKAARARSDTLAILDRNSVI
jgi:hypothetical protein